MKTRRQTKGAEASTDFRGLLEQLHDHSLHSSTSNIPASEQSVLAGASRQDVDKLLDRASRRRAAIRKQKDSSETNSRGCVIGSSQPKGSCVADEGLLYPRKNLDEFHAGDKVGHSDNSLTEQHMTSSLNRRHNAKDDSTLGGCNQQLHAEQEEELKFGHESGKTHSAKNETDIVDESGFRDEDFGWETGIAVQSEGIAIENSGEGGWTGELTIELEDETVGTTGIQFGKRSTRRATARDREFAELVHKAHLLCLLARGRLIDAACDDPLLQATLISIMPSHIKHGSSEKLTVRMLEPLVAWFQDTFSIYSDMDPYPPPAHNGDTLSVQLRDLLNQQIGTSEEVGALFVAFLRALGYTTRYVTVLDVVSLKPDAQSLQASAGWNSGAEDDFVPEISLHNRNFAKLGEILAQCAPQFLSPDTCLKSSHMNLHSNLNKSKVGSLDFEGRRRRRRGHKGEETNDFKELSVACLNQSAETKSEVRCKGQRKRYSSGCVEEGSASLRDLGSLSDTATIQEIHSKRKGDQEFELQLAMAMAATAAATEHKIVENTGIHTELEGKHNNMSSSKGSATSTIWNRGKLQKLDGDETGPSRKRSLAGGVVWSRKLGPLMHWGEVYCGGEGINGRWVHVDAGRGILDGASVVEGAAAACKFPLRYVVAFAGRGAKDVTSRYVTFWSNIAPLRVDESWWNATLSPLKELEAAATSGLSFNDSFHKSLPSVLKDIDETEQELSTGPKQQTGSAEAPDDLSHCKPSLSCLQSNDRGSIEDMELEVRAYTEPLPSNQQAFKNHHLYVLEKWLTKYQTLHPKGPVLGYCAGQPVFPRTCVQNLHAAEWWRRDGLKVKDGERPAKVVRTSHLAKKNLRSEIAGEDSGETSTTALFGKWQTESWQPPPAVGGIVPKNERGHVDVWSEKCLPPGTVHLCLPRLLPIAKKLEIDFAPAMVGFEIRNRRSVPVFEGIVVCKEFEDVLLAAYAEEEDRRTAELKKWREDQAVARWRQLLRSIATRQRLRTTYEVADSSNPELPVNSSVKKSRKVAGTCLLDGHKNVELNVMGNESKLINTDHNKVLSETQHEHTFPEENQSYDEDSGVWTKKCPCGFALHIEEM